MTQEFDKTYEWCPYCEKEVELLAIKTVQKCPSCGKYIVSCSMCHNCIPHCLFEEEAHRLNARQYTSKEGGQNG